MRIALVHDWLLRLGGAERVLFALHRIFPEAPIYTLFYDKKFVSEYLPQVKIIPSFLQKIPNIKKLHPWFKILMPSAVESFDLSEFDLVISSSHEFSHGVLVKQNSKHICYYHSPSRILWDRAHEYAEDFKKSGRGKIKISLIKLGQHFLRLWDWSAGQRPDIVIANSNHVAERIKKYYGREARVVYPPVEKLEVRSKKLEIENSKKSSLGFLPLTSYFLIVSQLYPHKNIDLAIKTFKLLNLNLVIIGEGPEKRRLKRLIGDSTNIRLLGFIPDEKLPYFYQNCLAYLICNEEDFGISPIEAMSFGKPVLALRRGGATETVLEDVTGEFFDPVIQLRQAASQPNAEGKSKMIYGVDKLEPNFLAEVIQSFKKEIENGRYDPGEIKKHSEKFGFERFKREILDILASLKYN